MSLLSIKSLFSKFSKWNFPSGKTTKAFLEELLPSDFQIILTPTTMPVHSRHSLQLQHVWAAVQLASLCCQYTITFMSQPATKSANAFWTDEETGALLNYLLHYWSESKGAGGFNMVFQSAIPQLLPFYERGATKEVSTSRVNGKSCVCFDFIQINVINI